MWLKKAILSHTLARLSNQAPFSNSSSLPLIAVVLFPHLPAAPNSLILTATFAPSRSGGHLSIMKRTSRIQMKTSGVIQLDRAAPGPRSLLGQLDRPKEEVRRPLGLPLPNSHHPQDTVRDHALRGRERQPPDRPVDAQVKPAVLDLGKCAGTKMVPRAKHGGVRDQKKILAT
jgi:hypothetical protein